MGLRMIDDRDDTIEFSRSSGDSEWDREDGDGGEFMGTVTRTDKDGATAYLKFRGTLIQVFGTISGRSSSSYSIDGADSIHIHKDDTDVGSSPKFQQLYFQSPELPNGEHTLEIKNRHDDNDEPLILDFFVVHSPEPSTTIAPIPPPPMRVSTFEPLPTPIAPITSTVTVNPPSFPFDQSSPTNVTGSDSSIVSTLVLTSRPPQIIITTVTASLNFTPTGSATALLSYHHSGNTSTPTSLSNGNSTHHTLLSKSAIAGITIGCIIPLIAAIISLIWHARRKRKNSPLKPYPFTSTTATSASNKGPTTSGLEVKRRISPRPESMQRLLKSSVGSDIQFTSSLPPPAGVSSPTPGNTGTEEANVATAQGALRRSLSTQNSTVYPYSQTGTFVGGPANAPIVAPPRGGDLHQRSSSLDFAERGIAGPAEHSEELPPYPETAGSSVRGP